MPKMWGAIPDMGITAGGMRLRKSVPKHLWGYYPRRKAVDCICFYGNGKTRDNPRSAGRVCVPTQPGSAGRQYDPFLGSSVRLPKQNGIWHRAGRFQDTGILQDGLVKRRKKSVFGKGNERNMQNEMKRGNR